MRFAAVGLDHRHIYHMVGELLAAGATCAGYCPETSDGRVLAGFRERFPFLAEAERQALLDDPSVDVLVTAETKSVPLAYHLAMLTTKPWVVLRKTYKSYMGDALSAETLSITTGSPQTLYLDGKDQRLLRGKAVVLLDDVVTTGSTFAGMRALIEKVDARVVCEAAVFTEGDPERWADVVALGHLPVFTERTGES